MAATLTSNRGDWQIALEFRSAAPYADKDGVDVSIRVRGNHWDGGSTHDLGASIDSVRLDAKEIAVMRNAIDLWVNLPLDQLAASELTGDFELACLPSQSLVFRFGSRTDTISVLNQVVTIKFSAGALEWESHFVTDQSCLRQFVEDLDHELRNSVH